MQTSIPKIFIDKPHRKQSAKKSKIASTYQINYLVEVTVPLRYGTKMSLCPKGLKSEIAHVIIGKSKFRRETICSVF